MTLAFDEYVCVEPELVKAVHWSGDQNDPVMQQVLVYCVNKAGETVGIQPGERGLFNLAIAPLEGKSSAPQIVARAGDYLVLGSSGKLKCYGEEWFKSRRVPVDVGFRELVYGQVVQLVDGLDDCEDVDSSIAAAVDRIVCAVAAVKVARLS